MPASEIRCVYTAVRIRLAFDVLIQVRRIDGDIELPETCIGTDIAQHEVEPGRFYRPDVLQLIIDQSDSTGDVSRHGVTEKRIKRVDTGCNNLTRIEALNGIIDLDVVEIDRCCKTLDPVSAVDEPWAPYEARRPVVRCFCRQICVSFRNR